MPDTTTAKPVRVALYARVSTADKGQDTETQLMPLRRLVEARGWHPTQYVDEGVSGSQNRRPALDRMMDDVRARKVDVVVVHRFDRFARTGHRSCLEPVGRARTTGSRPSHSTRD